MAPPNPGLTSLPDHLRGLAGILLSIVQTRVDLFVIELQEEQDRVWKMAFLLLLSASFLAMGLLLAALMVVLIFWDTHRLLAAGAVTFLYLGVALIALAKLRAMVSRSTPPFSATRQEFSNDLRALEGNGEGSHSTQHHA